MPPAYTGDVTFISTNQCKPRPVLGTRLVIETRLLLARIQYVTKIFIQGDWPVTTLQTMWNSLTIRWQFTTLLPCVTHIMLLCVIVSSGSKNATVHDGETKMKCTNSAKTTMDANMQLTINSFRQLFPDEIYPTTLPWHFPHSYQIPWHFQVYETSSHPMYTWCIQKWLYKC